MYKIRNLALHFTQISYRCLVIVSVLWLFLTVQWVDLQYANMGFSHYFHILFISCEHNSTVVELSCAFLKLFLVSVFVENSSKVHLDRREEQIKFNLSQSDLVIAQIYMIHQWHSFFKRQMGVTNCMSK